MGLDPGDLFASPDDAAIDAGNWARRQPLRYTVEFGGWIYPQNSCFTYNALSGSATSLPPQKFLSMRPPNAVAAWHTHVSSGDPSISNNFSGDPAIPGSGDRYSSLRLGVPLYLNTPAGDNKVYNGSTQDERVLPLFAKPKPCNC